MGQFVVYIELYNADLNDFDNLSTAMLNAGFSKKIIDNIGNVHNISDNTMYYINDDTINQAKVFDKAHYAAQQISLKHSIIVIKAEFISLYNLDMKEGQ